MKYYSSEKIDKIGAQYNMIISGRSDGKTYDIQKKIITKYATTGEQGALVRRWTEDFTGKRGQQMFSALVENGEIEKATGGRWNNIKYYASKWYFCNFDAESHKIVETDETPFCFGFALTSYEHDKSTSYNGVTTILFDEFMTKFNYLADEFIMFCNVVSTIVRQRTNVKIYMLGNTVTKFCPYFKEMGLIHIDKMKPGTIDVYQYGDSGLKVAVEYPDITRGGLFKKKSDIYFAFDNPKLQMIKTGAFELDIFPHCPRKYKPDEIQFIFFVIFSGKILQCEIVSNGNDCFVFVHPKTTEIQKPEQDLIYTPDKNMNQLNVRKNFMYPTDTIDSQIRDLYNAGRFCFNDNETGDIFKNFILSVK